MFDTPARAASAKQFFARLNKQGIKLHRKTRMLYRGRYVFINGESFVVAGKDSACLKALADQRLLNPETLLHASEDLIDSLHHWYKQGWLADLDN